MVQALVIALYILAFSVHAQEFAAPANPPPVGSAETADRDAVKTRLDLVCRDLTAAVCEQFGAPLHDGTGSTVEARQREDAAIAKGREYYRTTVVRTANYVTEVNRLLDTKDHRLVTLTGVDCDPAQVKCRGEMRKKLHEIFADNYTRSLGFPGVETVSYGCDGECKYSQKQADAYMELLHSRRLDTLFDIHDENVAPFFNTETYAFRKRTKETLWPEVKREMKAALEGMNLSKAHLDAIFLKIDRTELSFDCIGEGHDPNSFAWSSIEPRKITICQGLMRGNTSDFAMMSDLAHELAHQFDPCFIHFGDEGFHYTKIEGAKSQDEYAAQNPFAEGIKCLRDSERSAGIGLAGANTAASLAAITDLEAPPQDQKAPFCRGDRIQEAFADAMSAKVLARFADGDKISKRPAFTQEQVRAGLINASVHIAQPSATCRDPSIMRTQMSDDDYPTKWQRLNILLMGNKELRGLAGCSGSSKSSCL
jgi:hypothetical protein